MRLIWTEQCVQVLNSTSVIVMAIFKCDKACVLRGIPSLWAQNRFRKISPWKHVFYCLAIVLLQCKAPRNNAVMNALCGLTKQILFMQQLSHMYVQRCLHSNSFYTHNYCKIHAPNPLREITKRAFLLKKSTYSLLSHRLPIFKIVAISTAFIWRNYSVFSL